MEGLETLIKLKKEAGNHSPSLKMIIDGLGYDPVKHDFCFLSNPYATRNVVSKLKESINSESINRLVESYPADTKYVANNIARIEDVDPSFMVVGNGAVQCIEWVCEGWEIKNLYIPKPTFSTYYELLPNNHTLSTFNWLEEGISAKDFLDDAIQHNCDAIVIINPNNPSGTFFKSEELLNLINNDAGIKIIIDESFCHFLTDFEDYRQVRKVNSKNLVFIKSLAKDFGVAGVRLGYLYTKDTNLLNYALKKTTWNLNNFAVLVSEFFKNNEFRKEYWKARKRYLSDRDIFFKKLEQFKEIKTFPSQANFFLLHSEHFSEQFVFKLLINTGIYIRTMSDKVGLDQSFVRVACRTKEENDFFLQELNKEIHSSY